MIGTYEDTDRNYRFYNGNQWEGAKVEGVELIQQNFIRPIVKYKVAVIHDNLYEIVFSSQNYDNRAFHKEAERYCEMLNGYASKAWEQGKMDYKGRRVTKDAAINDEGIIYMDFDVEKMLPLFEIVKKNDIYYGNENDDDIQNQPYILIRKRMPRSNAVEYALSKGMSEAKAEYIVPDMETFDESGDAAKKELDDMVTIVHKLYKQNGTVHFSIATRYADILEDKDIGIPLYPIAHMVWEEKEGSARGEGEVRSLIPNQIEVNRTEVRRALAVKLQAYPRTVAIKEKLANPEALKKVGGVIYVKGNTVEDAHKIVGTLNPAQMSTDVVKLLEDLINVTRDLAGAGDTATGQVNPESASGRAILAVQAASRQPMTEQRESFKNLVEDLARIMLEYLIAYGEDGIQMEETVTDPNTGEEYIQYATVNKEILQKLRTTVKIDVTPIGVYDKLSQEQVLENLLTGGFFAVQRIPETRAWAETLPDNSSVPKQRILEICDRIEQDQQRIAAIESQAQMLQQRAQSFLMEDPTAQANDINEAMAQP
jgi:hypothetical protein